MILVPTMVWRLGYRRPQTIWIVLGFAVAPVLLCLGMANLKIPGGCVYLCLPNGRAPPRAGRWCHGRGCRGSG
ncbi:MAG: hypothetical protein ACU0B7_13150 [Paracoccaceae bacterium]